MLHARLNAPDVAVMMSFLKPSKSRSREAAAAEEAEAEEEAEDDAAGFEGLGSLFG